MERVRAELIEHLGGKPSAVQAALIDRIALLTLHVAQFDQKALEAGGLSERDGRQYLAYSNSLARALRDLGVRASSATGPSLAEHLARRAATGSPPPAAA